MSVELNSGHDAAFAARGFVHCPGVLPKPLLARTSAAIDRLYSSEEANVGHLGAEQME